MNVASAVKAPTVSTSPCENLITSSTPKNKVKPTATSAYIMPSISPFMKYCARRAASMRSSRPSCPALGRASTSWSANEDVDGRVKPGHDARGLLLPRQLALASLVLAVVPLDEFAVLDHILGDHQIGRAHV